MISFQFTQKKQVVVATPTICVNEKILQQVYFIEILFECCLENFCYTSYKNKKCLFECV